ncbi:MAG TPA: CDP-diacylglycerol--glycerol-3-phosphate 3-phosphatidyltransferase [Candidatus Nanopelagicaceae bacterium]|nr:CDP-diacylglycerol--glycerol-3-phosphate 3-phosphatidyltransferase [Candidatus Nanopelagicaceae bacterium]
MTSSESHRSKAPAPTKVGVVNLANSLTVLRILIVPFFVYALFHHEGSSMFWRYVATALFALASYTDRIDGQLARNRNTMTDFGALLDPIADKALIGSALVGLSYLGYLAWWVTVVILAREIGITVLRLAVLRRGVIPASRGGKAKTTVQGLAIFIYLWPLPVAAQPVRVGLMGLAVVLTIITGIDYLISAMRKPA